jgi:acyl-CoA synthetase (AMP-forming)/AMP-acid ligase II
MGAPVTFADAGDLETFDRNRSAALVSCGRPVSQTKVAIVDDSGLPLPDGHLGEIVVTSPSVASGYEGAGPNSGSTRFEDGCLYTGDAGLVVADELYVIGRIADCVKVRGQCLYVEQIEDLIAESIGVPSDSCAVVPSHDAEGDSVIAVVEAIRDEAVDTVVAVLAGLCGADLRSRIYKVARRGLPRTTSGKKRRRAMAESLASGELKGRLLYDSAVADS